MASHFISFLPLTTDHNFINHTPKAFAYLVLQKAVAKIHF
jgi:hypothetical protein